MIIRENHPDNPWLHTSRLEHPSPLHCRPDSLTAALRRRGTGAAQPAVAGVAEAVNSVINVHWAVMQLGLDLID